MHESQPDSIDSLIRAARQVLDGERDLAGDVLPTGGNPLPEITLVANQTPTTGNYADMTCQDKAALLAEMDENEVRPCTRCGLCKGRTQTVFGAGDANARLMFIGEGPGADEDAQGEPFVGRAGKLLTKMIVAMGLSREQVYIANVVKCRPPGNRAPSSEEMAGCWGYLQRQIEIIAPEVIVVLGNAAVKALLNTRTGITKLRGQWQELEGVAVMPTFHPAYVLRQYTPDNRGKVWSDLQAVMARLGMKT